MAGRKRIPDKLKVVAGTDRPDRANPDAPIASEGVMVAPEMLSEKGADYFYQVAAIMTSRNLASPDFSLGLMLLALRAEQVEILKIGVDDEGYSYTTEAGLKKANPQVAQLSDAMRHLQSLIVEYGLTPASLSKVSAGKQADVNPFAALG